MKGVNMVSDGLVRGDSDVVTRASLTDKVGQNRSHEKVDPGKSGEGAIKNGLLGATDDLIGTFGR